MVETGAHPGALPAAYGLLEQSHGSAIVTAVKKAENAEGLIVRCYNPAEQAADSEFRFERPSAPAWTCDLLENQLEPLEISGAHQVKLACTLKTHRDAMDRI